ncbi:VWA domain-containing protein [Lutimonas sp.]|uniref:VWA domain-containing protein n=1 Tax=Lutimonas sp. TaxID=1872403 RepID=UPI003D9ADA39
MDDAWLHINWQDFHFLRPHLLWFLAPALLVIMIALTGLRENVRWQDVIAPHLRQFMIKKGSENRKKWMHLAFFTCISIAIIGLAGPSWRKIQEPEKILETPLVILLDLSQSMMATDIQPTRLERAKFKIEDLLDANPGALTALIGFAGSSHTIVPLTRDYTIIKSHIKTLSPNVIPFPGSNLESALILADTLTSSTNAPGNVLLISDDFSEDSFVQIQNFVINTNNQMTIVPMNTLAGANIPGKRKNQFLKNKNGENIKSSLNQDILTKLASLEKVTISPLTLDKSDVELLANNISDSLEFKEDAEEKEDNWKDDGFWLIIPFALIVLVWFRKGWVIYSLFIMMTLSSCSEKSKFIDLWETKDYQAQKHFDKEEYEQAGTLFSDPMHQGVAWYKAGDYAKAIHAFEQDTTAQGAYNLGLAYYKNGDLAAAAMAFGKATAIDPDFKAAKNNQELVQQVLEGTSPAKAEEATEAPKEQTAKNIQNKDQEDLGGGGQEATKEDMQQERKEETVGTDTRTGKEMEEVPPDFESGKSESSQKVLMRKVDDDPSLFLKRKFKHQVKQKNIKANPQSTTW